MHVCAPHFVLLSICVYSLYVSTRLGCGLTCLCEEGGAADFAKVNELIAQACLSGRPVVPYEWANVPVGGMIFVPHGRHLLVIPTSQDATCVMYWPIFAKELALCTPPVVKQTWRKVCAAAHNANSSRKP